MHSHIPNFVDMAVALKDLLIPYLPFLTEGAVKGLGHGAGELVVKKIWTELEPKLKAKDDARVAAERLAEKPESAAWKAVFQEELETLLQENPDLVQALSQIMADNNIGTQINQVATGNGSQTIGQVFGGKVIGNVAGNVTISDIGLVKKQLHVLG